MRDLTWGDVQFLHTTDVHGWFTPHHSDEAPSTSFSADWGHWADFIRHARHKAHEQGQDLVVVDTGDLITGHGLSDAHASEARGHFSNDIFSMAEYDVLTIGNHELYSLDSVEDMRRRFIPRYNGRYLTSNVNVSIDNATVPLGSLFHTRILPQTGLRMTALGFVFDFVSPHPGQISTQPPLKMLREQWFVDLMQSDVAKTTDLWLLAGHMPLDGEEDEWNVLVSELRQWDSIGNKTIVALAGHTHIRNCRQIDERTIVLQSGRFHETAGFVAVNVSSDAIPAFSRKYIDLNPRNLAHHVGLPVQNLTTSYGQAIRSHLTRITDQWELNHVHGYSPRDFYLDKVDSDHPQSIMQIVRDILSRVFVEEADSMRLRGGDGNFSAATSRLVVLNSGSVRSDIKRGFFTTNDEYIVSPFSDSFYVVPSIPFDLASIVLPRLNEGHIREDEGQEGGRSEMRGAIRFSHMYPKLAARDVNEQSESIDDAPSEGYVTLDECGAGDDGDDTVHTAIPVRPFEPPYIGFLAESHSDTASSDQVDIITVKYLLPRIIDLLNEVKGTKRWTTDDARVYRDVSGNEMKTRDLWRRQAQEVWEQPTGDVWV